MAAFSPSPLMGEGWGEGGGAGISLCSIMRFTPFPQPTPARREGAEFSS